jgi:hypothetical protein
VGCCQELLRQELLCFVMLGVCCAAWSDFKLAGLSWMSRAAVAEQHRGCSARLACCVLFCMLSYSHMAVRLWSTILALYDADDWVWGVGSWRLLLWAINTMGYVMQPRELKGTTAIYPLTVLWRSGLQGSARVIRCLQSKAKNLSPSCAAALFDHEVRWPL